MQDNSSIDSSINTFGVTERKMIDETDILEIAKEELLLQGFTVIKSNLPEEILSKLKSESQKIYIEQVNELGGEHNLELIREHNVIRCPLSYNPIFKEAALDNNLHKFLNKIWNDNYVLLGQNCVFNKKDAMTYHTNWHRDLIYQHWTSSKPIIMNAILCLDPFNLDTGGTHVLPFSQHFECFPSDSYVKKYQILIEAKIGDFILIDAMIYHRIGKNYTDNPRMGLNHVLGLPFLAQHISIPDILEEKPEDDFTRKFLGYRWNPAKSVKCWRKEKLNELNTYQSKQDIDN